MMKKSRIGIVLILAFSYQTFSQFQLVGEFRPRFEYRGGYSKMLTKDQKPVLIISQRSRLSAYYQKGIISFGFGIQDVRVWGDDDTYSFTGVPGSKASIDLNEGWFGIKPYQGGLIKIGRQYWIYEDERILAQRGWNQSEVKYDAMLVQHSGKKFKADLGLSWNNSQERLFGNEYESAKMKTLNFLYLKQNISEFFYISAFGIASGFTASDTTPEINLQGTYGLYLCIKKGNLNALASVYYQNGKNRTGIKTSAYMFSAKGDYVFADKYSLGIGIDYLSGSDQGNTDPVYLSKNHSFDNLYGVRHRVFGHLDYFNNLPKSTGNGGLADIYVKLKWIFIPAANAGLDFHYFSLQNNVIDMTLENDRLLPKQLGQEFDFYISWDVAKFVNIRGGYSFMMATESMEKLQGVYGNARFPSWAWIMVTAKGTIFETSGN